MDVSVVVSTCNRKEDVARLLAGLERIVVRPGLEWELALVDNNSSDGTADFVLREYLPGAEFPLRYAFEARPGKSHGLNTGLSIVTGRIIAFTDDDAIVAPDWIQSIVDFFEANPDVSCAGGMVSLHDARDAPHAIRLSRQPRSYALADFPLRHVPIIGCNMAIRADLLHRVGDFDPDLGPGSRAGIAEDVDMLYRILRAGERICYEPLICVAHNHGRRTPAQLTVMRRGYVTGRGAFYCKHIFRGDRTVAYRALRECGSLAIRLFGAEMREAALDLAWLAAGFLRYIRFHDYRPGERGFRRAAIVSNPSRQP